MKRKIVNIGILCDECLPNTIATEELVQVISDETDRIIAEEKVSNVTDETILQIDFNGKTCPTCHKKFASKSNYEFHINRKVPCVFSEQPADKLAVPKNFKCKRCEYTFRSNYKLAAHMNRIKPCKIKSPPSPPNDTNMVEHEPNQVISNTLRLKKNIYIKSQFTQV